jgi:Rieske Fe-S protein
MADESQQNQQPERQCATRRCVLLGAGLAGIGGALAACSTAPVPYDANEEGQAPGAQAPAAPTTAAAGTGMAGGTTSTGTAGGAVAGTLLGTTSQIPVGGGMVFTAEKVVVTQPVKDQYKAFSAVCTHVGCTCNVVADGTINCPCHGAKCKITTGAAVAGPTSVPLSARTIVVADGKIMLQLSAPPRGLRPLRPPSPGAGTRRTSGLRPRGPLASPGAPRLARTAPVLARWRSPRRAGPPAVAASPRRRSRPLP